jgi:two-component sensor histidine kinase
MAAASSRRFQMKAQLSSVVDIRPADLVTTRAQLPRPTHRPNFRAEVAGASELSALIMSNPAAAIPRILADAAALCRAGSAGVSLLARDQADAVIIRWEYVSGELHGNVGLESLRAENPCGLCLDSGGTVVVRQPARAFQNLKTVHPAIMEQLIVPLRDHAYRSFGTLWVAAHEIGSRMSFEDARIVEHLATQLTLALHLLEQTREQVVALGQCRRLTEELLEEQILRRSAETSHRDLERKLAVAYVALNETNHRVKNTLSIAMGLLALHGRATSDAAIREELQSSRSRLEALSKVHQILSDTTDGSQMVWMQSLLETIANALQELFAASRERVRLHITADPISLGADEAIPIALVVNEAVTNAYKHAFPKGAAGTVAVHLSRVAHQGLLLRIMDDGIGMSDSSKRGLGVTLMHSLSDQLNAALTITAPADVKGTVVTLRLYRTAEDSSATQ